MEREEKLARLLRRALEVIALQQVAIEDLLIATDAHESLIANESPERHALLVNVRDQVRSRSSQELQSFSRAADVQSAIEELERVLKEFES